MEEMNQGTKMSLAAMAIEQTRLEVSATGRSDSENSRLNDIKVQLNSGKLTPEEVLEKLTALKKGRQEHDWDTE